MKKIVFGIVVLLLLVVGGAYVYVVNIDWNQHKDKIAGQFYNLTGKTIRFDGKLSFKIFPSPYLNAVDAKIYNGTDINAKPLLEIKNLVAELALGPLLSGEFDVKKMVLDGASINIDWDDKGLNWQADLSPDQRQMMEETRMVLNSVSLKNAEVNFVAESSGIDWKLTNLNGEVSAQSIFGPFRIEGNYLKGNSPEGFALTIGKLVENMPTTLNAVVTHPQSDSYMRFDGSFQLDNKQLNGGVIIESKKISELVNSSSSTVKLPQEYNKPIALGFDMMLNSQGLELSDMVIKFEDTQGAGTLQFPFDASDIHTIDVKFDFADLDMRPVIDMVRNFVAKYKDSPFVPDYNFNLRADVKAVRTTYQGQSLKNLQTEFEFNRDTLTVDNFNIILPGDTSLKVSGSVYPYEGELYYQAETTVTATDLMKTLKWLNIEPKANVVSVYKKMLATAKIAGNFEKIQVSPYKITLDKSTLSGEAGIVLGDRKDIMLVLNADTINFDNYISSIPEEQKSKMWAERMAYRFSKLGVLNDFDIVLNAKADLIIYESMPFEKVDFKGNILKGLMDIEYCKVEQVANTSLGLTGKISGFGGIPQMESLQYEIKSGDIASLINKLELKVPNLDYKKIKNLNMSGMINGSSDNFGINTEATIGALNVAYEGTINRQSELTRYKGNLDVKHPDFVKLLNNLKFGYEPSFSALGLFSLKAEIDGDKQLMKIGNLDTNIGYSNFVGNIDYDGTSVRPSFIGNLRINKFETDKFMPKKIERNLLNVQDQNKVVEFLDKPFWSRDKIDYTPYTQADIKGKFNVAELSYKNHMFKDSKFDLELVNGTANIKDFEANYNNTPIISQVSWHMLDKPTIAFSSKIEGANVNDFVLGGRTYNLKGGVFSTRFDFSSSAESEEKFVSELKGKGEFNATATEVGGFDLTSIYDDLIKREKTDGLVEFVKSKIGSGKTLFDKVGARLIVENGKFSLADAEMHNANTNVKVYGEGNLNTWDMNTVFNIKYAEPKYLPEFSVSLKNGMDNPMVDVNVSSLFKLYQNREDLREAAKEAEIVAEKTYWANLVDEQKKIADNLVLSTRSKLEKDIDSKIELAINMDNVNQYNALKQEIAKILASVIEVMDSVNPEEADATALDKLTTTNKKALSELEILAEKRDEIYLSDVKKKNELEYNKVVGTHNVLRQLVFTYNTQVDKYKERLANIVTDYKIDEDADYKKIVSNIDSKIDAMEKVNAKASEIQQMQNAEYKIADYEKSNVELEEIFTELSEARKELADLVKSLDDYMLPIIEQKEMAYKEQQEMDENRRRIEENTGSISIKKTGRTVKVVRDIEEIKNAEREINNEEVKVLDFSKEKYSSTQPVETNNENVIKKGRNIRMN